MLVLSRKLGQDIVIGDGITVKVLHVAGGRIRLGIDAPRDCAIRRGELPPQEDHPVVQRTSRKLVRPTVSRTANGSPKAALIDQPQ